MWKYKSWLFAQALGFLLMAANSANAGLITYAGSFILDNTSSVPEAPKGDVFQFTLTLDGNATDVDHSFFINGAGGLTFSGSYHGAVTGFKMTRDPANSGAWDPSALTFDFANSNLLTTDVNVPGPDPVAAPMNEHLTIDIPVLTVGSPVQRVYFNLYNSALYSPNATRQLWLDTSTSTNGFTLSDLFLHGMDTLSEFNSIRTPQSAALVDSVFLEAHPDFGSGTVQDLNAVPEPSTVMVWSILGLLGMAMNGRRRTR